MFETRLKEFIDTSTEVYNLLMATQPVLANTTKFAERRKLLLELVSFGYDGNGSEVKEFPTTERL